MKTIKILQQRTLNEWELKCYQKELRKGKPNSKQGILLQEKTRNEKGGK